MLFSFILHFRSWVAEVGFFIFNFFLICTDFWSVYMYVERDRVSRSWGEVYLSGHRAPGVLLLLSRGVAGTQQTLGVAHSPGLGLGVPAAPGLAWPFPHFLSLPFLFSCCLCFSCLPAWVCQWLPRECPELFNSCVLNLAERSVKREGWVGQVRILSPSLQVALKSHNWSRNWII